jgi:hypothetical protein
VVYLEKQQQQQQQLSLHDTEHHLTFNQGNEISGVSRHTVGLYINGSV